MSQDHYADRAAQLARAQRIWRKCGQATYA